MFPLKWVNFELFLDFLGFKDLNGLLESVRKPVPVGRWGEKRDKEAGWTGTPSP